MTLIRSVFFFWIEWIKGGNDYKLEMHCNRVGRLLHLCIFQWEIKKFTMIL